MLHGALGRIDEDDLDAGVALEQLLPARQGERPVLDRRVLDPAYAFRRRGRAGRELFRDKEGQGILAMPIRLLGLLGSLRAMQGFQPLPNGESWDYWDCRLMTDKNSQHSRHSTGLRIFQSAIRTQTGMSALLSEGFSARRPPHFIGIPL